MGRPEDERVKIPALVHFTRLGYNYVSLKNKIRKVDYDEDTNIFYELFRSSINRINNTELTLDEIKKIILEIKLKLDNDDLAKLFLPFFKMGLMALN